MLQTVRSKLCSRLQHNSDHSAVYAKSLQPDSAYCSLPWLAVSACCGENPVHAAEHLNNQRALPEPSGSGHNMLLVGKMHFLCMMLESRAVLM